MAKVTADQVREMRRLFETGMFGTYQLGKRFGLNHKTVRQIVDREVWRSISG